MCCQAYDSRLLKPLNWGLLNVTSLPWTVTGKPKGGFKYCGNPGSMFTVLTPLWLWPVSIYIKYIYVRLTLALSVIKMHFKRTFHHEWHRPLICLCWLFTPNLLLSVHASVLPTGLPVSKLLSWTDEKELVKAQVLHFKRALHHSERDPTYDFVLLAIPDGSAEQTLNLVACVIWILTLSEENYRGIIAQFRKRRGKKIKQKKEKKNVKKKEKEKIYRLSRGSVGPWWRLRCWEAAWCF